MRNPDMTNMQPLRRIGTEYAEESKRKVFTVPVAIYIVAEVLGLVSKHRATILSLAIIAGVLGLFYWQLAH